MAPPWTTRPATPADVTPIAELRAAVLRPDLSRLGRYDEHRVRQRLRDTYDPDHTTIIETGGVFAGCVAVRPASPPAGECWWLEHFYLATHAQGHGIGTTVLRDILRRGDEAGTPVRLNVLQGSPARRLYARHGFTVETEDPVDVFMLRPPTAGAGAAAASTTA